jgi:hypothetical protein
MTDSAVRTKRTLNVGEKPRVLYLLDGDNDKVLPAELVEPLVGTFRIIGSLRDVDLSEWDALITDRSLGAANVNSGWTRVAPDTLSVFMVIDREVDALMDRLAGGGSYGYLRIQRGVAGHHIDMVEGLPLGVEEVVLSDLRKTVAGRETQFGMGLDGTGKGFASAIEAFATGPRDILLAGKYRLKDTSTVWFVPHDVPNLLRWFKLALHDWSTSFPKQFPSMPDWKDTAQWATVAEGLAINELNQLRLEKTRALDAFQTRELELSQTIQTLRTESESYEKILLIGQSDQLQVAVSQALEELGFVVQDMDGTWPVGMRREDIRITDPAMHGWLALGEVTGTRKGLGQEKVTRAMNHLHKYVMTEKPDVSPPMWIIVNQFLEKDPAVRHEILNSDSIDALAEGGNLVVDTVALFVLLRGVRTEPHIASGARESLRTTAGRFGIPEAEALVARLTTANAVYLGHE